MDQLLTYITPTLLLPIAAIAAVFAFFAYYWSALASRRGTLQWIDRAMLPPLTFRRRRYAMEKKDALPLLLLTAVYAVTAFWGLGSFTNPQSFQSFSHSRTVEFTLSEEINLTRVDYYTGLSTGEYTLSVSADGVHWSELTLEQNYAKLFHWLTVQPAEGSAPARIFRLTASQSALELGELALYADGQSQPLSLNGGEGIAVTGGGALFDEQDTVPDHISYLNSAYFDEIYHARTAYEHLRGIYPYEVSHPPLGKLIISVGITLFGMTPFGWRFMGTLFGVLMLPILYVFLKNLFGKTPLAVCGTALFAFDFMHFVQTRIATIDTYGVFFILLAYFFLYRWFTVPDGTPMGRELLPLALCGLSFGLGIACKWTMFYAAAGLAVLYFWNLFLRRRDWPQEAHFPSWLVSVLGCGVVFFVVIPACIYTLSYLPYAAADTSGRSLVEIMWDNQVFMLTYHQGVHDSHPYSSRWWQWILDIRPILYYLDADTVGEGMKSAFAAFGNPLVVWGGLLAEGSLLWAALRRRSGRAAFLLVGWLAQLVPWMLIGRTTFEYHYFPSILFLVLALVFVMDELWDCSLPGGRAAVYGFTGLTLALFPLFYPVLTGMAAPVWYTTNLLRWFPSWPF